MKFKSVQVLAIALSATFAALGQSETFPTVELSLDNGKTVYRAGEPIMLTMTFNSDRKDLGVRLGREPLENVLDEVLISPNEGYFEWKKQYMRGAPYTTDVIHLQPLTDGPVRVTLPLNEFITFESPGHYKVRVKTTRVWKERSGPVAALITNDVSFEVKLMTDAEEAAETARLSAALDRAGSGQEQSRIATELSYLTGEAATREKVTRFLASARLGTYNPAMYYGLYTVRNRRPLIEMLEIAVRDVGRPLQGQILSALAKLRLLHEKPIPAKPVIRTPFFFEEEPDELRIRNVYLREVTAGLPRREGKNLNETVFAILVNLPRENPPADIVGKIRKLLIERFDEFTVFGQEMLLSSRWEVVRDSALIPSLEKMLKTVTYPDFARSRMRSYALQRLTELDAARARPFLIAEIRNTNAMMFDDTIASLEDVRLPEVDTVIVEQIQRLGTAQHLGPDTRAIEYWSKLAARFATAAVYKELLDIYKAHGYKWAKSARAFLLAYLARHNPGEAISLVDDELRRMDTDYTGSFLNDLTRFYYPPELTTLLESRIASDDARTASSTAWILAKYAPASSRAKIEARLQRWMSRWRNREAELNDGPTKSENQGEAMLQIELILALRDGRNWKLSESELRRLVAECKTKLCNSHFRISPHPGFN